MDFAFTPAQEAFRREVRRFLKDELPPDRPECLDPFVPEQWEHVPVVRRKLVQRGWMVLGWPKEYGGAGTSAVDQTIFNEELAYHGAPGKDVFGVQMLGPILIHFGTDEQKRRYLPPIAQAQVQWCQGFSEPAAGSDLAAVQTEAREDGDSFIVSGQKIWTSGAHKADAMFFLARTDRAAPKHKGISFLLLDMRSPGVTITPLITMSGQHHFNQVFLDNVRVPKRDLVGPKDQGWAVALKLLEFERASVEYSAKARRMLDRLMEALASGAADRLGAGRRALLRHRLADLAVEVQVARLMAYRAAWLQDRGEPPGIAPAISKLLGSEVAQRAGNLGMQVLGLSGNAIGEAADRSLPSYVGWHYLHNIAHTIGAGTSEVQRTVIARGLGLPRE